MGQDFLKKEMLKSKGGHVMVSSMLINEIFPNPKRTTVEDVEHLMATKSPALASVVIPEYGLCTARNQGDFAHMYQPRRKEQLESFCEMNNAEMVIDSDGFYHFRYKRNNTIKDIG